MLIPPNLTNLNQTTHNINRSRNMVSKITMKHSIIRKPKLYCVFVLIIFHSNPASVLSATLGSPRLQCVPGTPFSRLQQSSCLVHHSLYLFIYSYFHIPEIFSYRKSHIKYQSIHNTGKIVQLS